MRFLNRLIKSNVDYKGYTSLVIHSLEGCNLKCFGCHNYKELVETKHSKFYKDKDIINKIKLAGYMFDVLIFSGGEFLISDIKDIVKFLKKIRNEYKGIVIINTNGTFPDKIKTLIDLKLVEGFHMDVKYKFWEEDEMASKTLGVSHNYNEKVFSSFRILKNSLLEHNLFRTVNYPYLSKKYIEDINTFMIKNNSKWSLNDFV